MKWLIYGSVLFATFGLIACERTPSTYPTRVFLGAPEPTPFTRAYSMTEAPDGVRFYVQEDGDQTLLYSVKRERGGWSEPELVDLPHRSMITGPHFSRFDETFYFSTNAAFPGREGNNDLNIWRADYLGDGQFGTAEPLPMPEINTGANETDTATTEDGLVVFVSNHSRAGGGGYDLMQARLSDEGVWTRERMPDGINHFLTDDHIAMDPQGRWLIFYSHREPKAGNVDLWISQRLEGGDWAVPENLGPFVNTTAIEFGAGLSWDAETFFFSRDGMLFEVSTDSLHSTDRTFPE